GGGVALMYDLVPIHPVQRISFNGAAGPGIDVGALGKIVRDRAGPSPPVGRAADLARIVEDELRRHGYLHPRVTPRAEVQHAPERAALVFAVDPGARTTIGRVDVTGDSGVVEAALLRQLRVAPALPYEREAISARAEKYLEERRARGYLAAKLTITATF